MEIAITSTDDSKTKKAVTQFVFCDKYMYEKCVKYRIKVLKDFPHNIQFFKFAKQLPTKNNYPPALSKTVSFNFQNVNLFKVSIQPSASLSFFLFVFQAS